MDTWVAGFKVCRTIVLIMMRCRFVMFVRGEPVVVLGMVVVGIGVNMERRHQPRRGD